MHDAPPHQRGESTGRPGDGAGFGIGKIGGEPLAGRVGRERLPGLAAVVRDEHAGGKERTRAARGDAVLGVEEFDPRDRPAASTCSTSVHVAPPSLVASSTPREACE